MKWLIWPGSAAINRGAKRVPNEGTVTRKTAISASVFRSVLAQCQKGIKCSASGAPASGETTARQATQESPSRKATASQGNSFLRFFVSVPASRENGANDPAVAGVPDPVGSGIFFLPRPLRPLHSLRETSKNRHLSYNRVISVSSVGDRSAAARV